MHLQMSHEEQSTVKSIPATSTPVWELLHAFPGIEWFWLYVILTVLAQVDY
jgi:hypothetical protein